MSTIAISACLAQQSHALTAYLLHALLGQSKWPSSNYRRLLLLSHLAKQMPSGTHLNRVSLARGSSRAARLLYQYH